MVNSRDLAICVTCGMQYDQPLDEPPESCKICDDPRQYVPATGQSWTSLNHLGSQKFHNIWTQNKHDSRIFSIQSEINTGVNNESFTANMHGTSKRQKVGIGQRAVFIQTEHGNVLWDTVPYIDQDFINEVAEKGGLKAIILSHPHFYTTDLEWAAAFNCPVYLAVEDQEWLCRGDDPENPMRKFITNETQEIVPGVTAIKCGGHFPGSLVLHARESLFLSDTIMIVPSGLYHIDRVPGTVSYTFMYSFPNMIPLSPDEILRIWESIKPFEFAVTYGAFPEQDIKDKALKKRVLESMQIHIGRAGWKQHEIFSERL